MGEVISLSARRAARPAQPFAGRASLYFDLACPFTYLALERVERALPHVRYEPALADALHGGEPWADGSASECACAAAERRARELRLPLVWPARRRGPARLVMRAALYASEEGLAAPFALAASRLAYCGGYDLDDPELLAEAAAAAGLGLDESLRAAKDVTRDARLEATGRRLLAARGGPAPGAVGAPCPALW